MELHTEIRAVDFDYARARAINRVVGPGSVAQRVVDAELRVTLDQRIRVEQ